MNVLSFLVLVLVCVQCWTNSFSAWTPEVTLDTFGVSTSLLFLCKLCSNYIHTSKFHTCIVLFSYSGLKVRCGVTSFSGCTSEFWYKFCRAYTNSIRLDNKHCLINSFGQFYKSVLFHQNKTIFPQSSISLLIRFKFSIFRISNFQISNSAEIWRLSSIDLSFSRKQNIFPNLPVCSHFNSNLVTSHKKHQKCSLPA